MDVVDGIFDIFNTMISYLLATVHTFKFLCTQNKNLNFVRREVERTITSRCLSQRPLIAFICCFWHFFHCPLSCFSVCQVVLFEEKRSLSCTKCKRPYKPCKRPCKRLETMVKLTFQSNQDDQVAFIHQEQLTRLKEYIRSRPMYRCIYFTLFVIVAHQVITTRR